MIKSFSVSDTQNTSPFSGQTQPYLKPAQFHDDDLVLENIKHASYFLSAESNANLSPTPGDRSKKRIKLRVNQKFPTDFFDQPPDEGQENNRTYYLKNIPVKVVRTPEVLQAKNATMGEQRHANNTPSFGSQLMTSMDPSLHAEDRTISSRNKLFEGPPSREMITDIKHNTQARSRSHERGSFTGAGLYSLRMRPQALNSKLRLEEIGQNYSSIGGNIPLQPIENDQRSTSRLKRGGLQTPRKDTLSSFRKPRQVTFNLNSEEKLHESIVSPIAETSHVVITNSYYYSSRGINYQGDQAAGNPVKQPEDDFQSLQAYRKEPLKLAKSASRDSFHRENEFLRISRTNRLYLKAINKEQASLPLASTRKTLRALKADESENSRMTSDREIAEHQFTVDSNQINEKNAARQKIVPHKSFANFHKTLIKSLGLSPQEPLTTKNAGLVTKPITMLDTEPKKENSIDLITKIGRKVAEQRNIRDITESYMMREGHDFSFSKEYSKDESSIPTFKAQGKDVREKSPSPEKLEFVEQRNIGSRSQTRIRKKFVLIKRDESNEKSK